MVCVLNGIVCTNFVPECGDGKNREIVFRCFHSFHLSPYSFIYWYHWVDRIYSLSAFSGFAFAKCHTIRLFQPFHWKCWCCFCFSFCVLFLLLCELCSVFYWLLFIYLFISMHRRYRSWYCTHIDGIHSAPHTPYFLFEHNVSYVHTIPIEFRVVVFR